MACRLNPTSGKLPFDTLYIGDIIESYTEERFLTDGKPDIKKIEPVHAEHAGQLLLARGGDGRRAWSDGKKLKASAGKSRPSDWL